MNQFYIFLHIPHFPTGKILSFIRDLPECKIKLFAAAFPLGFLVVARKQVPCSGTHHPSPVIFQSCDLGGWVHSRSKRAARNKG